MSLVFSTLFSFHLSVIGNSGRADQNLPTASTSRVGFSRMSSRTTGIHFRNDLLEKDSLRNRILENGSGVAAADYDGDGLCDLYFCRLNGSNALFRNLGNWRFEETTRKAGVSCPDQYSTGTAFADVDGDRDLDLIVNSLDKGSRLFLNDGNGVFAECFDSGLSRQPGATSLALADIDLDGDLDLYSASYRFRTHKDYPVNLRSIELDDGYWKLPGDLSRRFVSTKDSNGKPMLLENARRDSLYENLGEGRFKAVPLGSSSLLSEDGLRYSEAPFDWSLSVMFRDVNHDRLPDLYVCSDFLHPDRFWINQGNFQFKDLAFPALRKTSWSSMAVDFGDLNRDGLDDFMVVDMLSPNRILRSRQRGNITASSWTEWSDQFRSQVMRNTLFRGRDNNTYAEIARLAGLEATDWSWSVVFMDVDLDGYEDVLVANGALHDVQDLDALASVRRESSGSNDSIRIEESRRALPSLNTPNYLFHNLGDFSFQEKGEEWGFASTNICQGMALADLDQDGDLDVAVNALNSNGEIYRNNISAPRIAVQLKGDVSGNTQGIGAKIHLYGKSIHQQQEVMSGGRYLSGDEAIRTFALPETSANYRLVVEWPDGKKCSVEEIKHNEILEISESDHSDSEYLSTDIQKGGSIPLFEDQSRFLEHRHRATSFNDDTVQPLLRRQIFRDGPDVVAFDFNRDAWTDILVGRHEGAVPDIFINLAGTGFKRLSDALPRKESKGIQTDWEVVLNDEGKVEVFGALSNYRMPGSIRNRIVRYIFSKGRLIPMTPVPLGFSCPGSLSLTDIDHDGDLDLFVGGRVDPGFYPRPAGSKLFRRVDGKYIEDKEQSNAFRNLGLVVDSEFKDLNGDSAPDLILLLEWGSPQIWMNLNGQFVNRTESLGLESLSGWWRSLAVGDVNEDGYPDLIAGNWGRNSNRPFSTGERRSIIWKPSRVAQAFIQLEGYRDFQAGEDFPYWDRDSLVPFFPEILKNYPTYSDFGRATLQDLMQVNEWHVRTLHAGFFDSVVLINRGDRFEAVSLPRVAQEAPVSGILLEDFNKDGFPDLFLNQNFSGTDIETSPLNDGIGLLLLGVGNGEFKSVPSSQSGILLYGDGKGCASLDWNRDGHLDIVTGFYNAGTRLLSNRMASDH